MLTCTYLWIYLSRHLLEPQAQFCFIVQLLDEAVACVVFFHIDVRNKPFFCYLVQVKYGFLIRISFVFACRFITDVTIAFRCVIDEELIIKCHKILHLVECVIKHNCRIECNEICAKKSDIIITLGKITTWKYLKYINTSLELWYFLIIILNNKEHMTKYLTVTCTNIPSDIKTSIYALEKRKRLYCKFKVLFYIRK